MSQNEQNLYSENKNVHFGDMQHNDLAQNAQKLQNYLCACPFLGHSYFEFKCFTVLRTCNIMHVFITYNHVQIYDT